MSSFSEWRTRTDIEPSSNPSVFERRYYERLLGPNELGFYWDSMHRGTADVLQHAVVEETVETATQTWNDHSIQSETNVRAAWVALKTQYPLLGARIEERRMCPSSSSSIADGAEGLSSTDIRPSEEVFFVVDPARLGTSEPPYAHPREVVFLSCASAAEATELEEGIINGFGWQDVWAWAKDVSLHGEGDQDFSSRILSNSLPACILFIQRTDLPSTFHVMIHAVHLITDGIGNSTLLSGFLDLLSHGARTNTSVCASTDYDALEKRLSISVACEALYPDAKPGYSSAKRRWHRVLGKVLLKLRNARIPEGGHTLPRIFRTSTPVTPGKSSNMTYAFTPSQTISILRGCKNLGITFGNAHPVLGQIAATRVLLRRRLQTLDKRKKQQVIDVTEDIDDDEWMFRRRQPMISGGPANLRPYLDPEWYAAGGAGNVSMIIGFFTLVLPFMPLGEAQILANGDELSVDATKMDTDITVLPPFEKMLSRKRFLLRCNMIRKQTSELFGHPRFLDLILAKMPGRIEWSRSGALAWRDGIPIVETNALVPVQEQPQVVGGAIVAYRVSSFGNWDHLVPAYYPRVSSSTSEPRLTSASSSVITSPLPILHLVQSTTRLRCRPTELYLGAATARAQLRLNVFWDENVYERQVVQQWLDEIKGAAEWFLGKEGMDEVGSDAQTGGVVAKL